MSRCSFQDSVSVGVIVVLAMAVLLGAMGWLGWQLSIGRQVVRTEPIGTLQGVVGGGDNRVALVLETSRGFYPLQEPVALARGVALVLQLRRNARWFVCDTQGVSCVGVAGAGFGEAAGTDQGPKGNQAPKGDGR